MHADHILTRVKRERSRTARRRAIERLERVELTQWQDVVPEHWAL
jgi:ABC-type polar amino acid transport system ATPase subunit